MTVAVVLKLEEIPRSSASSRTLAGEGACVAAEMSLGDHGYGGARRGGRTIPIIGYSALLVNKKASGRYQDLADLEALERIRK